MKRAIFVWLFMTFPCFMYSSECSPSRTIDSGFSHVQRIIKCQRDADRIFNDYMERRASSSTDSSADERSINTSQPASSFVAKALGRELSPRSPWASPHSFRNSSSSSRQINSSAISARRDLSSSFDSAADDEPEVTVSKESANKSVFEQEEDSVPQPQNNSTTKTTSAPDNTKKETKTSRVLRKIRRASLAGGFIAWSVWLLFKYKSPLSKPSLLLLESLRST